MRSYVLVLAALGLLCVGRTAVAKAFHADGDGAANTTVTLGTAKTIATIDERFLSFTIDAGQLTGLDFWGNNTVFNFLQPRLMNLTAPLLPAYMRIGGTAADELYYDMSDAPPDTPPAPYKKVLNKTVWDNVNAFASAVGDLQLVFGLNGGPGPREDLQWTSANAEVLVNYTTKNGFPVAGWELGNEPNLYLFNFKEYISGEQLAADFGVAREMLVKAGSNAFLAGIDAAYQLPVVGEIFPTYQKFMEAGGGQSVDLVTFHFYPMVSYRLFDPKLDPWLATPTKMIETGTLDLIDKPLELTLEYARLYGPSGLPIWLGETGGASGGGQPNVSNAFCDTLWWIDELGQMAEKGVSVVCRQTLAGSDYGLLADTDFSARPDWYASVLFKHLVGTGVLSADSDVATTRSYAYCGKCPGGAGDVVLVLINTADAEATVVVAGLDGDVARSDYLLTADSLSSLSVSINGVAMETHPSVAPDLKPVAGQGNGFSLPAYSALFSVVHGGAPDACTCP